MENKLCKIRDIYRVIQEFEQEFEKEYNMSLNEGMLLCILSKIKIASSGDLAKELGLTCSNTSKVIKSVEKKEFIKRVIGNNDKRQMYFSLTNEGLARMT
ncbi:MAG: MarR family transcriptional regulator, partial [Bacteroidales bacterium]